MRKRVISFVLVFFLVFNFGVGHYNVAHATGAEFALTAGGFALTAGAVTFAVGALAAGGLIYGGYKFCKSDLYKRIKLAAKSMTAAQIKKWNDWGASGLKKIKVKSKELQDAGISSILGALSSKISPSVSFPKESISSEIGGIRDAIDSSCISNSQKFVNSLNSKKSITGVSYISVVADSFKDVNVYLGSNKFLFTVDYTSPSSVLVGVGLQKRIRIVVFKGSSSPSFYTFYVTNFFNSASKTVATIVSSDYCKIVSNPVDVPTSGILIGNAYTYTKSDFDFISDLLGESVCPDFPVPFQDGWSFPAAKPGTVSFPSEVTLPLVDSVPTSGNWEDTFSKDYTNVISLPYSTVLADNPVISGDITVDIPVNPSIPVDPSIPIVPDFGGILEFLKNLVAPPTKDFDFKPLMKTVVNKFPFCVPFDLVSSFTLLKKESVTPVFEVEIVKGHKMLADFSIFNDFAKIVRSLILFGFVIWLIMVTRGLIKG